MGTDLPQLSAGSRRRVQASRWSTQPHFERAGPMAQAAGDGPDFIGNANQYDPGDCCNDPRMFLKAAMAEDQRRSPS